MVERAGRFVSSRGDGRTVAGGGGTDGPSERAIFGLPDGGLKGRGRGPGRCRGGGRGSSVRRNGVGAEFILNRVSRFLCNFSDYSLVALVEIPT